MRPDWHPRRLDLVHVQSPQLMDDPVAPGKPRARQEYSFPLASADIQDNEAVRKLRRAARQFARCPRPQADRKADSGSRAHSSAVSAELSGRPRGRQVPPAPVRTFNKTLDLARLIETANREPRSTTHGIMRRIA
jgi:hypothetical protein